MKRRFKRIVILDRALFYDIMVVELLQDGKPQQFEIFNGSPLTIRNSPTNLDEIIISGRYATVILQETYLLQRILINAISNATIFEARVQL